MGAVGGVLRSVMGGGTSVVSKVKSRPIQDALDQALGDWSGIVQSGKQAFGDYFSKYMAGAGNAARYGTEETGKIDDFYNGNIANSLAALRASRSKAVNDAADVAGNQAIRNSNLSRLNDEGGSSSYDSRMLIGALAPIRTAAALDTENQKRADFGYLTQSQLDLAGRRGEIQNRTAGYSLVPESVRRSMYGQDLGNLGNLTQLDQANHFYGLKQEGNMWADIGDSLDQGILNAASIYSSVGGGGGGMKDGGMYRKDYEGGGKVKGPGGPRSDSVKNVSLSDGEFVMPAAAVKMPGVLALLEHIRQCALHDSTAPKVNKPGHYEFGGMVGGGSFNAVPAWGAEGGMWGNMGEVAAGGGSYGSWGDPSNMPSSGSKAAPQKQSSGGGGGGLTAQAMALQARVDRDLMVQWFPSSTTFGSQPAPQMQVPQESPRRSAPQMPSMPQVPYWVPQGNAEAMNWRPQPNIQAPPISYDVPVQQPQPAAFGAPVQAPQMSYELPPEQRQQNPYAVGLTF